MRKILSFFFAVAFGVSMFATTYTVAGDSEALFGTSWDPANTANDMALVEGSTYKFVKEGVTLYESWINFKVCEDHAWTKSYGKDGGNFYFQVTETASYNVTITFDASTEEISYSLVKTGSATGKPAIKLHGTFAEVWDDTEAFAIADDEKSASLKLTLEKKAYEFGVKIGGQWTANATIFTRENNSAVVTGDSGNMSLEADAAGEYTFKWTYETNTLEVTFPEGAAPVVKVTIFFVNSLDWEAVNAYVWDADGNPKHTWPGEAMTLTEQKVGENEVYSFTFPEDYVNIIFGNGHGAQTEDLAVDASTPYFVPGGLNEDKYTGTWYVSVDDITTAVDNLTTDTKAFKFMQDGQLYIRANGQVYSILGK